jgi:NADPH-dependent 2,4-dienoyl-CoA reductase/sulfur reductase-like enzyme
MRLAGGLLSDGGRPSAGCRRATGWRGGGRVAGAAERADHARTTVTGAYDHGTYGALERVGLHKPARPNLPRECFWRIVAKHAVLASGALERPMAFENNDRPGIMMASAVRTYLNRYGVVPGKRVTLFANTDAGARRGARADGGGREGGGDHRPAPRCLRRRGLPGACGAEVVGTRGRLPCGHQVRKGSESSRSRPIAWPCRAAGTRRST